MKDEKNENFFTPARICPHESNKSPLFCGSINRFSPGTPQNEYEISSPLK